ncbi:uncharacterized protein LOC135491671 [Lineus longissimus]|uniref:uncharacterized protein LOC135491671 n=1 Tax=Lineus longissimus TaxID=88925 RepID=UPI002B4DD97C
MQDNELQAEYSISLNSSPCADFLTSEIDRGDSQGEYGGLMGEMSASYSDGKDPEMDIFDKPLGMDDFGIDIRNDLYQSLDADMKLGNGDDTNTGESDDAQDFNPIQNLKKTQGSKTKKMKFTKDLKETEAVNNNLEDHNQTGVVSLSGDNEGSLNSINKEKKVSKNSPGGRRAPSKSRNSRRGSRPLKNSKNSPKCSGEGSECDHDNLPVLANGSPPPTLSVSESQGNDYIQIEAGFVGSNCDTDHNNMQNVIVRLEPTFNMHNDLSINNVQAIRDEFPDLNHESSGIEGEDAGFGSPDAVGGFLNSQTNDMALTIVPSPSTSTEPVASSSNMLITSAPDLVNASSSDTPIILNANVLNQGTERNVSYVMIPVSLVQQLQAANQPSTSTAGGSSTSLQPRPQIVQLLNENYGYVCHVCRYSGKMPYLLENHMKTCHLPHRPYICLGCYKAFNLRGTALCHIRLKHLEAGTQMMIDQDMEGLQTVECQKLMQLIFRCHVCDSVGKYMSGVNNKPKNLNPHLFVCKVHAEVTPSQ